MVYTIKTDVTEDGKVHQTCGFLKPVQPRGDKLEPFTHTVYINSTKIKLETLLGDKITWIYDTKEAEIRKALIKLGWTPPK